MSEQPKTPNLIEVAMTVLDNGLAAQERALLNMGIPLEFLARVLMQHSASILALAEPAAIRAEMMRGLIRDYPAMVRKAQLASVTTTGGIILPHARADALAEADAGS